MDYRNISISDFNSMYENIGLLPMGTWRQPFNFIFNFKLPPHMKLCSRTDHKTGQFIGNKLKEININNKKECISIGEIAFPSNATVSYICDKDSKCH